MTTFSKHAALALVIGSVVPAVLRAQIPLGSEFRVNTYTTGYQGPQAVATAASGGFVVVWMNAFDGMGYTGDVRGQRYDSAGTPLGTELVINTSTAQPISGLAVAGHADGSFIVVWTGYEVPGNLGVLGQRFASSGAPVGTELLLNAYTTGGQGFPTVASAGGGDFIVGWTSVDPVGQDGSGAGVFGRRFDGSGAAVGTEFQINTYTTGPQGKPRVASDANGNFVYVWESSGQDGDALGLFGQRYTSAGAVAGSEFAVNSDTTGDQRGAGVATDSDGSFVVVWDSVNQIASFPDVFGRGFSSAGTPLGDEFRINTYTSGGQASTAVTRAAGGNFLVAWESYYDQDGAGFGTFARRIASDGTPLSAEFRVNTTTAGDEGYPAVAGLTGGDFVVVWLAVETPFNPDVFGQRIAAAPSSLDHYKCYQGKDLKNPKFNKLTGVATVDQITGAPVNVSKIKYVCMPVNKNGQGINDPTTHLVCYQVKGPNLAPRPEVEVSTQFQISRFELKKPKLLCLPGTKTVLP